LCPHLLHVRPERLEAMFFDLLRRLALTTKAWRRLQKGTCKHCFSPGV